MAIWLPIDKKTPTVVRQIREEWEARTIWVDMSYHRLITKRSHHPVDSRKTLPRSNLRQALLNAEGIENDTVISHCRIKRPLKTIVRFCSRYGIEERLQFMTFSVKKLLPRLLEQLMIPPAMRSGRQLEKQ